jgi:hypothetical protein
LRDFALRLSWRISDILFACRFVLLVTSGLISNIRHFLPVIHPSVVKLVAALRYPDFILYKYQPIVGSFVVTKAASSPSVISNSMSVPRSKRVASCRPQQCSCPLLQKTREH